MGAMAGLQPQHFLWDVVDRIAVLRLNRPERKNPLTFESYAELRDTFRALPYAMDVDVVVIAPNGGNFCSGGDVHDIIGPLVGMQMKELLAFTRMTGDLVKAMIGCGKPIIAAVDGVCVGAGAIIAMASDLRLATPGAKCAFLFTRVGLAGCDMGACAMLPRIIGQGRAAELLYTGRVMRADEGERWGFWNALHPAEELEGAAMALARGLAAGPTFAHGMTKTQLNQEWNMGLEQAIEAEAQAQAICMQTQDFERAYRAFVAKETPIFRGD
jgi:enoyl-CoA hydratase/carnithine racemase